MEEWAVVAPIRTGDIITSWTFDLPAVALMCAAALAYLIGVRRVRGSGGSWPWWRTVLFIIVGLGSLIYVGQGREDTQWLGDLLEGRDRTRAAPTFMPDGLYLAQIEYDDKWGLPRETPRILPAF